MQTDQTQASQSRWAKYRNKIIIGLMVVGGLVAAVWFKKAIVAIFWPTPVVVQTFQASAPAKGMPDKPTQIVTPSVPLKTFDKKIAANKMKLPPEIVDDPKKALLTTAYVPSSDNAHTTAAILDTETGITTTIVREEPRSLLGFGGSGGVGIRGGYSLGGITGTLYVRQKLIRVGNVQVSGYAEFSGSEIRQPELKAMAEIEVWTWK